MTTEVSKAHTDPNLVHSENDDCPIYSPQIPYLTIQKLLPRFPSGTDLILAYNSIEKKFEECWCLEATPSWEFIEHNKEKWPWPTGMAWYGATEQEVLYKADADLRKVRR